MKNVVVAAFVLCLAFEARAGISSITAHGTTYTPDERVPLFVDSSAKNSVMVKGQFMDLCTGVESNDGRFVPSIGRRIAGSNSAVEILINAGNAPDLDGATITIKFAVGEETFRVKAFKSRVTGFDLNGRTNATCSVGSSVTLEVQGDVANVTKGIAGTMLDVADNRYEIGAKLATSTATSARFPLKCTAPGTFTVSRSWFKDARVSGTAADSMVRGSATYSVTVVSP
jgi:hypothetical protein